MESEKVKKNKPVQQSVLYLSILVGIAMICFTIMVTWGEITDMAILGIFGTGIVTGITAIAGLTQVRD